MAAAGAGAAGLAPGAVGLKFDVAPSSFNRRKMLNTHPTPKAEVHCNLRGVLSTVPLTVFLSINAFSFSTSPFGGGAPWQIGTPDGEFEDPCPHACLPAVGLVVLPVCCRSHWYLGRKAKHLTQLLTQKYALRQQCTRKEAGNACRTRLQPRLTIHGFVRFPCQNPLPFLLLFMLLFPSLSIPTPL